MRTKPLNNSRQSKAKKIYAILQDFLESDLTHHICLDIGCSDGSISNSLASHFKYVIGIDVDKNTIISGNRLVVAENIDLAIASGYSLPFEENSIDVIICAQVYEHVIDKKSLAGEIWRVLHPGGVCFFSGPNRLAVMEEHYWLPFLSWFPRFISNLYIKLSRRGEIYDVYPLYLWQIRHMWKDFFVHDYTPHLIRNPEKYHVNEYLKFMLILKHVPLNILKAMSIFYPNYNWILVKPN
jgi:SAM-dependent methyltransferase